MKSVLNEIDKHEILDKVSIIQSSSLIFQKRLATVAKTQFHQSYQVYCPKIIPKQTLSILKKNFNQLQIRANIKYSIGVGQRLKQYTNLHQVFSQQETIISHIPGQILLIEVWSTRCGPCQQSMKNNQKMQENNEQKWKNKVRIIAVSVDSQKQSIQQRVNSRGWNKIQHLTLLKYNDEHPLIRDFQIEGIPFVVLVDKQGIIDFTGNPQEINLQERINELFSQCKKEQKNIYKEPSLHESLSQSLLFRIVEQKVIGKILSEQFLLEKSKQFAVFFISAEQNIEICNGEIKKVLTKINISTDEKTTQLIEDIKNLLKKINPKFYCIEENQIQIQDIPQIQNSQCGDCKNKLVYPLYWCKWDTSGNKFRCKNCVQKKSDEQDQFYSYNSNSLLLLGPWNQVYLSNLGHNLQPQNPKGQDNRHLFGCNSCGKCPQKIGQPRYICTICNFHPNKDFQFCDLCQQCVNSIIQGDQNIIQQLKSDGHDPNHPLLRVLYRVHDYSLF